MTVFFSPYFYIYTDQPNVTFITENQTVYDGDTVWLSCTADGFPAPNITWTRSSTKRDVQMPMTIRGKQDEGVYRCTAHNGIGNPVTADVFVTVQCKSQLSPLFPNKDDSRLNESKNKYKSLLFSQAAERTESLNP